MKKRKKKRLRFFVFCVRKGNILDFSVDVGEKRKKSKGKKLKSIEFSYRRKICRTGKKEQKEKFFFFSFFGRVVIMYLLVCGKLGVIGEKKRKKKKEILVKPHRRKKF